MPYTRYLIDASTLDAARREKVYQLMHDWTDILNVDLSRPGVYDAFFTQSDLPILEDPAFSGCRIVDITQSDI